MKKIIDGRKYDTKTATEISHTEWWDDSVNREQQETLYKKKTGEFFRFDDKRTTWGDIYDYCRIEPLSIEEAKSWVENHDNVIYEDVFGEVDE